LSQSCTIVGLALTSAWAQPAKDPTIVEVQAGDTFSAIAARFTGNIRSSRQVYNAELSGLANPGHINVGMRLEVVADAAGTRYLRLVGGPGARVVAKVQPARAAAPPTAPIPAPAVPVTPAVVVAPAVPAAVAAAADTPLVIGVLPNIGALALQAQYDNFKRYLERLGPQKVRVVLPRTSKLSSTAPCGVSLTWPWRRRTSHV